jgi:predicted transcriptional regulator
VKAVTVIIIVFSILLLPTVSYAELSLEALEMVEAMRRKLDEQKGIDSSATQPQEAYNVPEDTSSEEEYIVGAELRAALDRLRLKVYGNAARSAIDSSGSGKVLNPKKRQQKFIKTVKENKNTDLYVAGLMLRHAIDKIKMTRRPDELNEHIIQEHQVAKVKENSDEIAVYVKTKRIDSSKTSKTDSADKMSDQYANSSFIKNMRMLRSQKPANRELNKLSKTPQSSALPAKSQLQPSSEFSDEGYQMNAKSDTIEEDRKINNELGKHEFRMPQNYRIIVR